MWKRSLLALGLILLLISAVAWGFRDRLLLAGLDRAYQRGIAAQGRPELPDGLHAGLCGAGSPMPDPGRAGPCVAVVAGAHLFVVDSGPGSTRNLALMGLPPAAAEAVFISHFHSDHIGDLGELMLQHWAGGAARRPLDIYGPVGVDRVVQGFDDAYALDRDYRIRHHGPNVVPPSGFGGASHPFAIDPTGSPTLVLQAADLKVWAFAVDHRPVEPAVGYRFEYKSRVLVISGDTAPTPALQRAATGADVLVHEALSPKLVAMQRQAALAAGRGNLAAILHDIPTYHSTPEAAADTAQRAGVRYLLLDHIVPPTPAILDGVFLGDARSRFSGPLRVGQDGDFLSMPTGSHEVRRTNRLRRWPF